VKYNEFCRAKIQFSNGRGIREDLALEDELDLGSRLGHALFNLGFALTDGCGGFHFEDDNVLLHRAEVDLNRHLDVALFGVVRIVGFEWQIDQLSREGRM
jgi:hypothetical protein